MIFECGIEVSDHVEALIFDLDGTIVNNMPVHIAAWELTGREFDVPITGQMIEEIAGIPTRQVIDIFKERYGWTLDSQAFTLQKQSNYRKLKKEAGKTEVIQPIVDIINHYHGQLPMSVGTGSSRRNALLALEDIGMLDYFDIIVTADDVTHPKPHAESFLKGAHHMGVPPKKCLVFEDGDMGIQAAIDGNIPYIDVRPYIQ